jgi:hypothetical protein
MGIGDIMMWQAYPSDSLKAFEECKPDRSVEGDGMVCFWFKGETTCASVKELQKLKGQGKRFELNNGLTVELNAFGESVDMQSLMKGKGLVPAGPGGEDLGPTIELFVYQKVNGKEERSKILRSAELPFLPVAKQPDDFRADFYHPSVKGRVEILAKDRKLAYRAWQKAFKRVNASGDLEIGRPVETFSMGGANAGPIAAGEGKSVLEMTALRYVGPGEEGIERFGPSQLIVARPFDKGEEKERGLSKAARMRLTWTDSSGQAKQDDFWLEQNLPPPWGSAHRRQIHRTDAGGDKPILTSLNVRETNVGFALKLVNFDLEVDPGTKMASSYTSYVVQVDVRHNPEVEKLYEQFNDASDAAHKQAARVELDELVTTKIDAHLQKLKGKSPDEQQKIAEEDRDLANHTVTMNRPLDYPDLDGRQLRFFQENYLAPDKDRGTPLGSVFRVNYDPGRPVKYLGSGLIVFGIFLMFYMRAYFFKRPAQGAVT